jgi:hypothetical protein
MALREALAWSGQQEQQPIRAVLAHQRANEQFPRAGERHRRGESFFEPVARLLQRHFAAVTPGQEAGHVCGGTLGPLGVELVCTAVGSNAHCLAVRALLLDASHQQQFHRYLWHQELGDIRSRCGDLNMPTCFTPHVQQEGCELLHDRFLSNTLVSRHI